MADPQKELRAAWGDLIDLLQQARDAIDQPELMPAPASERNLAEGYRYLMGYVHSAIERAFHGDPVRPVFRNALSIINRATIDNADAIYFFAAIDGSQSYLIRGHKTPTSAPPHYVIFETSAGVLAGDSGDLRELTPGMKTQTGRLDSAEIEVAPDGGFEILLAPEKPRGYKGNFIPTLKVVDRPHPTDPEMPPQRYANFISGRQLFYDWGHEEPIHLEIHQIGAEGTAPHSYCAEQAAEELRRCGELVRGQMLFWNAFWTILMGTYGHREGGIPGIEFSRNGFNQINAASGATGGGQSTNLYAGGVFELEPDEALIIENRVAAQPQYIGFQLGNLWGESIDYANSMGSLNGYQSEVDEDGVIRYVVAHRDPGVPNWLDTTGHREGFLTPRWTYSKTPAKKDWPQISAKKVAFDEIRAHLPATTGTVTTEQRRAQISVRQRHVQRRYRCF